LPAVNIATGPLDAYLVNAATASQTKLNSVSSWYRDIDLSPDGKTVVFTARDSAGYSQIFVANVSSFDSPLQLTADDTRDHYNARFSPDGATILSTIDQNSAVSLSIIPAAGGTETAIVPPGLLKSWSPSLTPDGTKLIFEGQANSNVNAAIYSINVNGSGLTQLTNLSGGYWDWRVSLSPDGTQMLFTRHSGSGGSNNIYVVGISGESTGAATQLTRDGYSWDSIYLTDYILFVSSKDNQSSTGNNNIYGMNPDGSGVIRLTNTTLEDAFDLSAI
jgi:Tol biopolymer transport system component